MKSFFKNIDGSTSVLFAGSVVTVVLASALALDYSRVTQTHQLSQNALDSAILAAVLRPDLEDAEKQDYALEVFLENTGFDAQNVHLSLTPEGDSIYGASVDVDTKLAFGGLIGVNEKTVNVGSQTKFSESEVETETGASIPSVLGSACIISTGTEQWTPGIRFNSNSELSSTECEVHVYNTGSQAVNFNSNVTVDVQKLCVAGSGSLDNRQASERTTNTEYGCSVDPVPFPSGVAAPASTSCDYNNGNYDGGSVTLSPGTYCGWFNFNSAPDVQLQPGTYVLKNGGWNVNGGNWTGQGVTFYYADDSSKIQFNSDVNADIAAPATGDYAGVVMTDAANVGNYPQDFILNSSDSFKLTGLVNLPNRNVTLNSDSQLTGAFLGLVAKNIIINSNAVLNVSRVDSAPTTAGSGEGDSGGTGSTTTETTQVAETTSTTQASIEAILMK